MDVATMAFLNRFQWATIFGAASRQLPCATKTEATRPCTATDRTCHCADRPIYQDSGTQTIDESILNPNDDHLDETERVLESSPDEAPGETFDEECGGENHSEYIDEQSVREERYVRIHDEVEEDYTAGPLRLVLATDGLKDDCPALLMNLELSGLIQEAIYAERQFVRAERHETDTRIELMRLESAVKREIRAHEYRLDQDQVDDLETAAVASATDEAVSAASVKELENLRLLLADVGQRKQRAAAQVETEAMLLHNCTRALTECLEDAFTAAELVWPEEQAPDIDVEPLDLKQEYQAFCEQLREMEEGSQASSVAALNVTGDTYLRVPPQVLGPEEQAEADLKSAFFDAQERLQNATFYFDKRGMARHEDRQRTDEDEQVFDLRWVQHISELTREVIDAEEGLAIAKTAAREAGLNVTLEYQSSGFAETEGSGDRMSIGDELIVPARMENISGWLSGVDEEVSSETASSADVDDWEARDVEICDSISLVAYGVDRRKIDGWQQDCRRYNEE